VVVGLGATSAEWLMRVVYLLVADGNRRSMYIGLGTLILLIILLILIF
jgi:hypothetical protein